MIITLTGFMGCGKTAIGQHLARKLNLDFIDLDVYIFHNSGLYPWEIIQNQSEKKFREIESQILEKLFETKKDAVVSLGGGTFINTANREKIQRKSLSIFIDTPFEKIIENIRTSDDIRPLLTKNEYGEIDIRSTFLFYLRRLPYYSRAHLRFKNTFESPGEAATELAKLIKNKTDE